VCTLLKKIDCGKILYIGRKYIIPGSDVYYFEPSILLKKYFDLIETEKTKLNESCIGHSKYRTREEEIRESDKESEMIEISFSF
jgi:hypothetical protein